MSMKKEWKRLTQDEFIERAKKVHNNYYSYHNAIFTTVNNKIEITCPVHGNFWQNAHNHLQGSKCKQCAMALRSKNRTKSTEQFIKEASIAHNNYYDYSKTHYVKSSENVTVTCPVHGDFQQQANSHVRGAGCSTCSRVGVHYGWSYSQWEQAGKNSKEFEGFSLYVLKCFNDNEVFYKIGKTFVNIKRRYECKNVLPYAYIIMDQIYGDARTISELESWLHQQFKLSQYTPSIPFTGSTECFTIANYNILKEYINDYTNDKGNTT